MPIERARTLLAEAERTGQAVLGINCFDARSVVWAIEAAEAEEAPVLLMLYPGHARYVGYEAFAAVARIHAERVRVPVAVHLDHCDAPAVIREAIEGGFRSVMVDASSLDFEGNVRATREIVAYAHARGVDVEAELGFVGSASLASDFQDSGRFTRPEEAARFVERTGVDSLAVAIGSAHGRYVAPPRLDLERLSRIDAAVDVPLVLHGGTGIPDGQVREAIRRGIRKINLGTGYAQAVFAATRDHVGTPAASTGLPVFGMMDAQRDAALAFLRERLRAIRVPQARPNR
jgi:ketose-bisphosphate aldolase